MSQEPVEIQPVAATPFSGNEPEIVETCEAEEPESEDQLTEHGYGHGV